MKPLFRFALTALLPALVVPNAFGQTSAYPLERESTIGKMRADSVEKSHRLVTDGVAVEYVLDMSQTLAQSAGSFPLTVKLLDTDEVGVYAYPGGFLLVTSELIRRMGTESELAGVLAHEIAHIAAHHGTAVPDSSATPGKLTFIFGGKWGVCTRFSSSMAMPRALTGQARKYEEEADQLARDYLTKTGFDPAGVAAGFERIRPASAYSRFSDVQQRLARPAAKSPGLR